MKHPNEMVQMDILGPFYLSNSSQRNYIISCLDDCSRKVASRWSKRKRSVDILNVLEDWIVINGKPDRVMHDNGKQFTSKMFRHFLVHNQIKDKQIPNSFLPTATRENRSYNTGLLYLSIEYKRFSFFKYIHYPIPFLITSSEHQILIVQCCIQSVYDLQFSGPAKILQDNICK